VDFKIPEDLKMVQTLARDFVKDQLIPLEKEVLGRESDLEGAKRGLTPEKEAELVKMVRELGLWGLSVPEQLGGVGLGVLGTCLVEEELAKTVLPFNFGDVTPILYDCNEQQKSDYLLPLIEGKKSAFLALVEPGKGMDPSALEMTAAECDGNYVLNGRKIVFAKKGEADFAIVFAVTDLAKGIREGVTCFLVDNGARGFTVQGSGEKTGWRAQVAEPVTLIFQDCQVPAAKILGEEGKAFHLGKKWLTGRRIVRGARCVGAAVRVLDKVTEYAKSWTSFGQVISGWPGIQALLAEIAIDIQAARLMVYQAAWKADAGEDIHCEAAMVKVFATEMLKRVADRAVLIKNGPGPVQGIPLEYLCRSLQEQNIAERALEVQKSIVAEDILKSGRIL
jgi:acyl-CoA dehydrogenase